MEQISTLRIRCKVWLHMRLSFTAIAVQITAKSHKSLLPDSVIGTGTIDLAQSAGSRGVTVVPLSSKTGQSAGKVISASLLACHGIAHVCPMFNPHRCTSHTSWRLLIMAPDLATEAMCGTWITLPHTVFTFERLLTESCAPVQVQFVVTQGQAPGAGNISQPQPGETLTAQRSVAHRDVWSSVKCGSRGHTISEGLCRFCDLQHPWLQRCHRAVDTVH